MRIEVTEEGKMYFRSVMSLCGIILSFLKRMEEGFCEANLLTGPPVFVIRKSCRKYPIFRISYRILDSTLLLLHLCDVA
jgi:hypothetical protein